MFIPLFHQAKTFPTDYIYFNQISGGNKNAWANYEYDYYFHGIKKSSEELIAEIGDSKITIASNCNLSNYFDFYPNIQYTYTTYLERSSIDWDYGLFGINYIPPSMLNSGNWKSSGIQKIFYHKGNPIVALIKRTDKSDFSGLKNLEKGNLDDAKTSLEKAINSDPNNIWLYAQLSNILLKQGNFDSFMENLQKGRKIYSHYEPFYLLEAQYWYTKRDYIKSNEVLNKLLEVNSRYENAMPLKRAVTEKLNMIN